MKRHRLRLLGSAILASALLATGHVAHAQPKGGAKAAKQAPGSPQFIVKLKNSSPLKSARTKPNDTTQLFQGFRLVRDFRPIAGAKLRTTSSAFGRFVVVQVDGSATEAEALKALRKDPNVEYAEVDQVVSVVKTPDDPDYAELWGMAKIRAPQAWDLETGKASVVVAVIDTGVEYSHPDLSANMWTNTGEIPGNGIDDDGNGYVDDFYGYDFANNDADPRDDNFHGTHCAGTVGGVGDNALGVAGVCWNVKIMALKFMGKSGSGLSSDAIGCIQYAVENGAQVLSNSWGGGGRSQAVEDAIDAARAAGVLFIAAAGNDDTDTVHYPSGYPSAFSVAATDQNDKKAVFSNYGETIDVAAPGVLIRSTTLGGNYRNASGTSMATPHVAGLAALILSRNAKLTPEQIELVITSSAVDLGDPGKDRIFGHGRIDAYAALQLVDPNATAFPELRLTSPRVGQVVNVPTPVTGTARGATFARYVLEAVHPGGSEWVTLAHSTAPVEDGALGTLTPNSSWSDGTGAVRLTVTDTSGAQFRTATGFTFRTTQLDSPTVLAELKAGDSVEIRGTAGGPGFARYTLEYGYGEAPSAWVPISTSTTQVGEGPLGTWVVPNLPDGTYSLRLRTEFSQGPRTSSTLVTIETRVEGWAGATLDQTYWAFTDTPRVLASPQGPRVIASYGMAPSVILSFTAKDMPYVALRAFDAGKPAADFDPQAERFASRPGTPAVGDLDNDGVDEFVVAARVHSAGGKHWRLFVKDLKGATLWSKRLSQGDVDQDVVVPSLADLDGDGDLDVLCGGGPTLGSIQAFDAQGNALPGFPLVRPGAVGIPRHFVVANLDADPSPELGCWTRWDHGGFRFSVFKADGTPYPGGKALDSGTFGGIFAPLPPVAGDVDGDGRLELATWIYGRSTGSRLHVLRPDGTSLPGWPQSTTYGVGLSIGEFTRPGKDDVLLIDSGARLIAFQADGTKGLYRACGSQGLRRADPVIADLDGDGSNDVVVKAFVKVDPAADARHGAAVQVLRLIAVNKRGELLSGFPKQLALPLRTGNSPRTSGGLCLADVTGDGSPELVSGSHGTFYAAGAAPSQRGRLTAYRTSLNAASRIAWGSARGNRRNTGSNWVAPPPDRKPPSVAFTSPQDGAQVPGNLVHATLSASDNVRVTEVRVYANGKRIRTLTQAPYAFAWGPKLFKKGADREVTLSARAFDAAGNQSPLASIKVKLGLGEEQIPVPGPALADDGK